MDRNKIYDTVVDMLEQAIGIERSLCKPEASLQGELGIESIDLLDIQFRLERTFKIEIIRDELFPDDIFADKCVSTENGLVTEHGLNELKIAIPFVNWERVTLPLKVSDIQNVYTVDSLVNFVESKLTQMAT